MLRELLNLINPCINLWWAFLCWCCCQFQSGNICLYKGSCYQFAHISSIFPWGLVVLQQFSKKKKKMVWIPFCLNYWSYLVFFLYFSLKIIAWITRISELISKVLELMLLYITPVSVLVYYLFGCKMFSIHHLIQLLLKRLKNAWS